MNQPVGQGVGGQQCSAHQERRPEVEENQRAGQAVHQEQPEGRSEQDLSKPVAAAVQDSAERPSRQEARGEHDHSATEHGPSTLKACFDDSPKPQVETGGRRVMTSLPSFPYHPTVVFDGPYWVHDFSKPSPDGWQAPYPYSVGRYDEHRPTMYTTELFGGDRDHHVGLDLGGPVNTPIHAFASGEIADIALNDEDGSYGPTLITKHTLCLPQMVGGPLEEVPRTFWVLYGHLSWESIAGWKKGDRFSPGDVLATMGDESENGGWPPHVHVQMAWEAPENGDLPGVVHQKDRADALERYPDPRLICGPLY